MPQRPLNILYATNGYKPAFRVGGPVLSVAAVAERLVHKGHRVTVFTTNANLGEDLDVPVDQPVEVDGVTVWYFARRRLLSPDLPVLSYFAQSSGFLYAPRMRRALDAMMRDIDLVHTHMPFIYPTLAAARAAFHHRKPLFYHSRGVFDPGRLRFRTLKKKVYIRAIERPIMDHASAVIALTDAERDAYRALGVRTRCEVIPNGVAVAEYRDVSMADDSRLGLYPGAIVALFMGRLHPNKGADRLVEAFIQIARDVPDAVLLMAGPDESSLQAKLEQLVNAASLQHRIKFLGMVAGQQKLDLFARADLFCLPSDGEGFSMAVLEAMASRTAVLLSPGCHFPQARAANAGIVVDTDVGSLARALRELLGNREGLRTMGANGHNLVKREFEWNTIVDRLADLYQSAVA